MTSTLCQSVALGRIIAPWLAMIAELFGIMVKAILLMVGNVSNSLHEPRVCCRVAGAASHQMAMLVLPGLDDASGCVLLPTSERHRRRSPETAGVFQDVFPSAPR